MSIFSKIWHFTTKLVINWLNPEPDRSGQGTQVTKASSDDHIKIVYGTRKVAGTIVFMNVSNPDDGDDVENDLLHLIIVWCEGGIDGVDDILLNDISINDAKFDGKKYRAAYANHFKNGMGSYSDPNLKSAGWDAASKAHRLDGLACSYVRLEWSIAEDAPFTGVPDVAAIIRGKRVKNLHTNAVEYSENPAYILHDYLTHPIYGKPLSASDYSLQHLKDAAIIAKTLVPAYQGAQITQPLFTCNLVIDTGVSILDNVELIVKSMRGLLPIINGELSLIIEQDDPVTSEGLNESHFKSSLKYSEGGKSKRYNRVIVEYIDKDLNYSEQDAYWPEKGSDLEQQWLEQDNNVLLEYRFKVSSCTNYYEARQMARVIAMLSREALNFNVTAAPIAMQFTVGDVVPISHKKLGWDNKPFRLLNSSMQDNGDYKLTFREHQPYIYNWLSGVVRPPIPDTSLPPPRNVLLPTGLVATVLDDGHIKISWVSPYNYFDIRIYKNDTFLTRAVTAAPEYIVDKLDAGSYEIDVRARSNLGYHSDYATLAFEITSPAIPTVLIDSATYNTIAMSATVLGASLGTTFEWQFLGTENQPVNEPNTHTGYSYTYTGLQPSTQYTFKVRTKNTAGLSPWVVVLATTTESDLLEYIDSIPLTKLSAEAQTLIADINAQVDRLRPETENNLPSLIAKNLDAITGLAEKVQVIDAENPNNLQQQLADSNSKITDLERVTEVLDASIDSSLPALIKINNIAIEQQRLAQQNIGLSLLNVTSAYTNWRNEYERRAFNSERLIDAAVYVDPDTGTIVNRAFAYTNESFNSATLMIDGVNSKITLASQQIAQSQNRISQAEAQLIIQAAQINQKATFAEVEGQIAGALAALQPAYSWQFNTSSEGFDPDSHNATGYIVATAQISSPAISYNAAENPMFRLRVRKHSGATWKGDIKFNGGTTTLHLPEPTGSDFETLTLDATGTAGYTGTITSLEFDLGACDIDFIEVGKRGANDLALADITARTTELEQDINAATGTMAQYATTAWVNALGYQTQSNVQTLIDSFNTQYSIAATLQEFNDQDIIVKANAAQTWIDGANATIRDQVTSILNSEDGVNQRISTAEQSIDAIAGEISQSITQVNGLEIDVKGLGLNEVIAAYNKMQQDKELAEQSFSLATANQKLTAMTDDVKSLATQTLELAGLYGQNAAFLTSLNQAFANERTARSSTELELRAEITREGTRSVAQANERVDAIVGYCVDAEGNRVDEVNAMACIAAGHEWIDGPLVQLINDYTTVFVNSKGYQTAANVEQFISTFDGEYSITATIQQINAEGIITAAKEAQQWINAAEGTITNLITQFVAQPDGINESIAFAHEQIQANADDIQNEATARQQLSVRMGEAESDLVSLDEAIVNEQQARASQGTQLRIEFQSQDLAMLATANEFTRAVTGFCVDANGERVDQDDAVQCELDGHTWVDGPAVRRAINISAAYVDGKGYQTQSNVNQLIDTFNTQYSITATLQQFADNNTLQKANNAQQFINGAELYIANRITAYNAAEGGVDAKFTDVQQRLDAAEGAVTTSILQIQGLELGQQAQGLNDVIAAYNQFKQDQDLATLNVKASLANEKLQAQTTDIESLAQQQLELAAIFNSNNAIITSLNKAVANQYQSSVIRDQRYQATFENVTARFSDVTTALATIDEANTLRDIEFESFVADTIASFDEVSETFASQNQAFSTLQQTLTSKIENDTEAAKNTAISTAQQYTRTAVGYCVNAEGQVTSENDAVQCVADGGSWVAGPLAEFIANMQISNGTDSASIKQLRQVFETVDGKLVARGGWTLDNNGRAVGVVGYNDGVVGNLDLVGDVIRQGVMFGDTFVPTSYVDNSDPLNPVHIFKGRLILGDGHQVSSLDDIKAQAGADGKTRYVEYVYSVTGSSSWHSEYTTGDLYRRERTMENGVAITPWSVPARITGLKGDDGYTPVKGTDYFDGNDGSFVSFIYIAAQSVPAKPSGGSFNGTVEQIPQYWNDTPVYVAGYVTYVSKARYVSNGNSWVNQGWSNPVPYIIKGTDGSSGSRGAGRYTVATSTGAWSDATANAAVPSNTPVTDDIVTIYKSSDPTIETTKKYNGSTWVGYTLLVNGNALIRGSVDGDSFKAATKITAPKIIGGEFAVTDPESDYLDIVGRSTPFGPSADLISWYGPKINGVTWNSAAQEPIYSGMSKSNAVSYKTNTGSFYFGGTFQAGTLSISRQSTSTSGALNVSTGPFTIPGGTTSITIAASVSAQGSGMGNGSCPINQYKPNAIIDIERLVGSTWQSIAGNNAMGTASCSQEGGEIFITVFTGVSTNTSMTVSAGQSLQLRAVANTVAFPYNEGGISVSGSRSVSIVVTGSN